MKIRIFLLNLSGHSKFSVLLMLKLKPKVLEIRRLKVEFPHVALLSQYIFLFFAVCVI